MKSIQAMLAYVGDAVDKGIGCSFAWWGKLITKRPLLVIKATLLFSLLCLFGFIFFYDVEKDGEDLFSPEDAESFDDNDYVDSLYPFYNRRTRVVAVQHPRHRDNDTCEERLLLSDDEMARQNIRALFEIYREIQRVEIVYDDIAYGFRDICIKVPNADAAILEPCLISSILDLWNYNETIILSDDFDPLGDINSDETLLNRFGLELGVESVLGKRDDSKCELSNERSSNVEAFGITIIYIYEEEEVRGAEIDPQSLRWIEALRDRMREISKISILDAYVADQVLVGQEANEQLQNDLKLLPLGNMLVFIYTNIVLFKNNWSACKMHLSVVSFVAIGMALVTAFGIAMTLGVKYNSVVNALPFLAVGLGLDDTFVIVGAYQRLPFELSVQDKITKTLENAGSSILVTSATDICAFLMGMNSNLPALRVFSIYASLAIFFDFAYQVSFFVAFLVLESRREAGHVIIDRAALVKRLFSLRGHSDQQNTTSAPTEQEMKARNANTSASATGNPDTEPLDNPGERKKLLGKDNYDHSIPSFSTKLAGTIIPSLTLHPIGRWVVFALEGGLLAIAIYGCTKVSMHFDHVQWFTRDGSALETAFEVEGEYFNGDQVSFGVYTKEAAGGDYFYHQDELLALKTALEADPYVIPPVHSWYDGYINWLEMQTNYIQTTNGRIPNATAFNTWLQEYLNGNGSMFQQSVIFSSEPNSQVISSRISAVTVEIVSGKESVRLVDSIRDSIRGAAPSFDPVPFAIDFLFFDGFRTIVSETLKNVILAAVGVFIMNIVVLSNILGALAVVGMVALTDVVLVGYMWYVDEYFNNVTAINLVLAVGISVDYSAHIAHSFLVLDGDRLSRAKAALEHIGGEVLSGAFTTWLAMSVLGFSDHFILQSFFKMFFAIIVVGVWHGVFFLPAVLSLIGPSPYPSRLVADSAPV